MKAHAAPLQRNRTAVYAQDRVTSEPVFQFADTRPDAERQRTLQQKADHAVVQQKPDNGLPDNLKSGIEHLSGYSMDDVKVHYNSSKPRALNAHAYAQGTDIHLAPGQEKHLPHEAWHVVQQKQGRVAGTRQLKGTSVNDDPALEQEADRMGANALSAAKTSAPAQLKEQAIGGGPVQRFGTIRFANLNGNNPELLEKAQSVIDALQGAPIIQQYLANKNMLITLEGVGILDTPASVSEDGEQVRVTLSTAFFKKESVGRIVGMLSHEIGVHPLGNERLTQGERDDENHVINNNVTLGTTLGEQLLYEEDTKMQRDHFFAAVKGFPRYEVYMQTTYDLVKSLAFMLEVNHPTVTPNDLRDAVMSYLADIATILATNDERLQLIWNPFAVSRAVKYFAEIRRDWLDFIGGEEQPNGLEADLRLLIQQVTPQPQDGLDFIKNAGGLFINTVSAKLLQKSTTTVNNEHYQDQHTNLWMPTPNQQHILQDYNLNLQGHSFHTLNYHLLDTLDLIIGQANGTAYRAVIRGVPENDLEQSVLAWINQEIKMHGDLGISPYPALEFIAKTLNIRLRVLKPDGKMYSYGQNGGPWITLVEMGQPEAHYRWAQ